MDGKTPALLIFNIFYSTPAPQLVRNEGKENQKEKTKIYNSQHSLQYQLNVIVEHLKCENTVLAYVALP